MLLVANAARFAKGQGALVNGRPQFGGSDCGRKQWGNRRLVVLTAERLAYRVRR
jgi:hypothetical protein